MLNLPVIFVFDMLRTELEMSSGNHPKTDSQTDRVNQTYQERADIGLAQEQEERLLSNKKRNKGGGKPET